MNPQEETKKQHERGQALAEFSLILPMLLMVVFGIIDFGRVLFVYSDASGSLRDGARNAQILGFSSGTPNYVNCSGIEGQALSTRFVSNEVVDVYYWDTTDPTSSGLTAYNTLLTGDALRATAHYTCFGGDTLGISSMTIVNSSGSGLDNGDILHLHYTGHIAFFTPFLSALVDGLDLDFYAQRTVVTQLLLGSSEGIDNDFDGLDDRWEFMWWGCRDDSDNLWLVDSQFRFDELSNWQSWTISRDDLSVTGQPWFIDDSVHDSNDICIPYDVKNPDGTTPETVPVPQTIELDATNAIRDFDLDDCNNGCEEHRNTQPISYGSNDGTDTDGDGLTDGDEANIYFTNPTGGDIYYCDESQRSAAGTFPYDGVPDGYDSDCDGVPDGVEVGVIEPNNPSMVYPGKELLSPAPTGYPYRPSEALIQDGNGDGFFDSVDTDGDGLTDYQEYYDADPCVGTAGIDDSREIPTGYTFSPATPYDCHPDLSAPVTINFPGAYGTLVADGIATPIEYLTNSTNYDEIDPVSELDGVDTDSDGATDYEEILGFGPFNFELNRVMQFNVYYTTNPNYEDGDLPNGDDEGGGLIGTLDGDEVGSPIPDDPNGYTDPGAWDTDGDGISDWQELNIYQSNPLDDDGDFDNLSDSLEATGVLISVTIGGTPSSYTVNILSSPPLSPGNSNSDGDANTGKDSDGDGNADVTNPATGELLSGETLIDSDACDNMNDGYEVNIMGTDPTKLDTDGDGISDCKEVDIDLDPLDDDFDNDGTVDGSDCAPRDPALTTTCSTASTDGDSLPDAWENANYGSHGDYTVYDELGDPDGDGCNNLCEYERGTSAMPDDLIDCGLNLSAPAMVDRNDRNPVAGSDGIADGWDTDCDGRSDNNELPDSSPSNYDTDGDGLIDSFELNYSYNGLPNPLNPRSANSDNDVLNDYTEAITYAGLCSGLGINADSGDTDGDGLRDHLEVNPSAYTSDLPVGYPYSATGTNPCGAGDSDGWSDFDEIYLYTGANPNNADTDGDGIQDDVENDISGTIYTVYDNTTCNGDGTSTAGGDGIPDGRDTDCDGLDDGDEFYNIAYTDLRDMTPLDGFTMTIPICLADGGSILELMSLLNPNSWDSDGDGLSDGYEVFTSFTNPQLVDTDGDVATGGANDYVEVTDGDATTDPLCGGTASSSDRDSDTLLNIDEQNGYDLTSYNWYGLETSPGVYDLIHTDPDNADSDGDGIDDNVELGWDDVALTINGQDFTYMYDDTLGVTQTVTYDSTAGTGLVTNPTHEDNDLDGDSDGLDSDGDGIDDLTEMNGQTFDIDCDADGTIDATVTRVSDPSRYDTDGDGMPDGAEIANNTDPLDGECGPAIILAKASAVLDMVINMYWHVTGSGTESMTDDAAELTAINYADGFGYATNFTSRIIEIAFRSDSGCPPPASKPDLDPVITGAGGTILTDQTQITGQCYWVASVSIDQLIIILFDANVAEALLPADVGL